MESHPPASEALPAAQAPGQPAAARGPRHAFFHLVCPLLGLSRLCICHPLSSISGWESLCRGLYWKVNFLSEGLSVGLVYCFDAWHTVVGHPLQASCNPILHSYHFSSVAQSCPTLCHPMDFPVHHQLPEFTQTYVH